MAGSRRRWRPEQRVTGIVVATCAAAALLVALVLIDPSDEPLARVDLPVILLAVLLVLGELRPILISRGEDSGDEVTISSTFALALVLLAPIGTAVLAQLVAVTVDDLLRRKPIRRVLFNQAQYVLTLAAAAAAYAVTSGRQELAPPGPFTAADIGPALAAAAAFFVVNNGLTGLVVATAQDRPVLPKLWADARSQLPTAGVLLSFAPVAVAALHFSLALLPLLLLPILAVHRNTSLAVERERQALHDALTGLPNRTLLSDRLTRVAGEVERLGGRGAVLLLDLDHFKEINDTLGHFVGDELLCLVAERVRSAVSDETTVARLGGDEFAVLAPDVAADGERDVAERIVGALSQPFRVQDVRLEVQASVGVAVMPEHGRDATTLLQRADVALYQAKQQRGSWAVYSASSDRHTPERLSLLGELRDGIERDELVVHYQPQCEAATGRPVSVEALVRWAHPTRGLLQPGEFVPVAENTGLIGALTLAVLDQALAQVRRWHDAGETLTVAVNLSVRSLTDLDLPGQVGAALARHGLPPAALTLEVTETTILVDPLRAATVLGQLRALGVSLSVDDFGTGYSSLAQLKRLAAQELKIDRSFVRTMLTDSDDALIVRSTIELARNLGLRTVAEGVEDANTWWMLRALGCDLVQGYHLCRPVPADTLELWLREPPVVPDTGPGVLPRARRGERAVPPPRTGTATARGLGTTPG